MIKKLSFTLLLALTASICFAQKNKIPFEAYNVAEGLPEEFVRGLVQDDKGFIWFGTQNGLVKYDGYQFKVYRQASDKTDSTALQIRNIGGGLFKARDGKIWIGSFGRIASFDPLTEKFRNYYPVNNDKASDRVLSILLFEDEKGNIWFKNGYLTNGQNGEFTTIRLNPTTGEMKQYLLQDINSGSRYFKGGTAESSGTIWLLDGSNNLNKLNPEIDEFEIIIPAGKAMSASSSVPVTITNMAKGSVNRLILSAVHGVYIFDSNLQKIVKSYEHSATNREGLPDSVIYAFEDSKGQFWVSHRGGKLSIIDPNTDNIQSFSYGTAPLPYQKNIRSIEAFRFYDQTDQGIWFQAWGPGFGVKLFVHYQFDPKTFKIYDYNFNLRDNPLLKDRIPFLFLKDRTGLLWLGTRPGLYKQAPKKRQMDLYRHHADEPDGLPSDTINYLLEDSKKRLWIATANGLALYQPDQENFRIFRNVASNQGSLSNNNVTSLTEDADGKIWVGTANGLNQWQESTGIFKRFFYKPGETNTITFVFPDNQQRLWTSIRDKGVFILNKNTGQVLKSFIPEAKNPASLTSSQIDVFYQDSRGSIWLGDSRDNQFGLYKLNLAEDGFTHYLRVTGDSTSISSNEMRFIAEDGKQRLWIGTDGGLNLYNHDENKFKQFTDGKLASVQGFSTDKRGEPWFATYSGGGLVSVDAEKGIITAYDETKGLLHNDLDPGGLTGIIAKDDFGRFWLPSRRGLSIFDPETKTFESYLEKDGFQTNVGRYQSIRTFSGDIWIGGNHGLNHIVPANLLKKDTTLASIVITQVGINDSLYAKPDGIIFKQSVAYTDAIELEYWQKDLSIDFVALHFLRSEDNQYSWKLENYDKDWSAPSKERKASYTNLSPGNYIFRVKASNADGIWNEEGIALAITILPPWWLTWWAYGFYGIFLIGLIWGISRARAKKLELENKVLESKVNERTKELEESIEELKATQSQLIQSEKMASLGELTAGIAHEIQNPLNFVNNFSEVNKELIRELKSEIKKGNTEEINSIANDIESNEDKIIHHGKRADSIVKNMLQHSRISSGEKEAMDINALCDEYLNLSYHGLRAKDKSFNAKFETNFDPTLPKASVVPQDIGRVILNLINNAFYAVNEKAKLQTSGYEPKVIVSTKHIDGKIQISVRDNGNGIPESIKEKIFQPFFTTKPAGQGTGLGLSLSYDIVKAHGGEITINTSENEGTEFIIQIPIEKNA
ncbi:MAG TPA: two-component regulator propeller domain-containing protein [Cyclobacteriaceae bacterium]